MLWLDVLFELLFFGTVVCGWFGAFFEAFKKEFGVVEEFICVGVVGLDFDSKFFEIEVALEDSLFLVEADIGVGELF